MLKLFILLAGLMFATDSCANNGFNLDKEVECLADNIYYEARGESYAGMVAVGQVTLNRKHSHRFPNDLCSVVNQHKINWLGLKIYQFSWKAVPRGGTVDGSSMAMAETIAHKLVRGDISSVIDQADHYYACDGFNRIQPPIWARVYKFVGKIDNHCFYKSYVF